MFTHTRHIGIIGFRESGKTVFLTSLINHIRYHRDSNNFSLRRKNKDNTTTELRIYDVNYRENEKIQNWPSFDYSDQRSLMNDKATPKWPNRTVDRSVAHLKFKIGEKRTHTKSCEIFLYDIPGERIDDFVMLSESYEDWSEDVIKNIRIDYKSKDENLTVAIDEYLDVTSISESPNPEKIIQSYKKIMAAGYRAKKRISTPSIFLLDETGKRFGDKKHDNKDKNGTVNVEKVLQLCTSGLPGKEFAPLPEEWFKKAHESRKSQEYKIIQQFESNYKTYIKKFVHPLAKHLSQCYGLICMIDFVEILKNEHNEINRYRGLIETIINDLKPDNRFHLFSSHIKRLAFVVPKFDIFLKYNTEDKEGETIKNTEDKERDKIKNLLKSLTKCYYENTTCVTAENFVCSSVTSLKNRPFHIPDWKKFPEKDWFPEKEYPEQDQPENFFDPEQNLICPNWPKDEGEAPHQIGIDDVFCFITNWF